MKDLLAVVVFLVGAGWLWFGALLIPSCPLGSECTDWVYLVVPVGVAAFQAVGIALLWWARSTQPRKWLRVLYMVGMIFLTGFFLISAFALFMGMVFTGTITTPAHVITPEY
jgi:hypothetical protein